ncbi:MAG TPA: TIGR02281 family clan AA aspartic protease [Burkholderiales bacterium]|nr:TIGR02281 family clan AA aspartic protease [Burkholderiales bacterium]
MKRADCIAVLGLALALAGPAAATDLNVVGLFGSKAVVSINGSQPRTLSVGQRSPEGVELVAVDRETATFEVDGQRRTLRLGQPYVSRAAGTGSSVTIKADAGGMFWTVGQVNGGNVRFLVDTGATMISLPAADARRLGIDYLKGQRDGVQTAAGRNSAYRVTLDSVRVGDITMNGVEAHVVEAGLPFALLGMSFLNRTEMKREGETMVLIKRF